MSMPKEIREILERLLQQEKHEDELVDKITARIRAEVQEHGVALTQAGEAVAFGLIAEMARFAKDVQNNPLSPENAVAFFDAFCVAWCERRSAPLHENRDARKTADLLFDELKCPSLIK